LIAAGEVVGQSPWTAVDDLWSSMRYGSVRGAIERFVAAGALGSFLFLPRRADASPKPLDPLVAGVGLVAIALAFSFSGHPASLAAPALGVPFDVAHQLAAGAWLGGMVFLGPLAGSGDSAAGLGQWRAAVLRFTNVARWAVIVVLVTGVAQTLRIDGSPLNLFRTGHGRAVLFKIVLFALMLWAGNVNRERIARRLEAVRQPTSGTRWALRRAMATELVVGVTILATTAMLVSLSPA
jgi:putative copper export protein